MNLMRMFNKVKRKKKEDPKIIIEFVNRRHSGNLIRNGDRSIIQISKKFRNYDMPVMFILAHELGHLQLNHLRSPEEPPHRIWKQELDAWAFASSSFSGAILNKMIRYAVPCLKTYSKWFGYKYNEKEIKNILITNMEGARDE